MIFQIQVLLNVIRQYSELLLAMFLKIEKLLFGDVICT